MKTAIADVTAFHNACDVPILAAPSIPNADRVRLRIKLIVEEVNAELVPAMLDGDLIEIADAIGDSIYVLIGAALEYGIPLDRIWNAIQTANMAKVDPVTGKVVRRKSDDKILKPEGWQPPDIHKAVFMQETD